MYYNQGKKIQIDRKPIFANLAKNVIQENRTFLKEDRLYTFYQLLNQIPKDTNVVEVGVYKGGSTKFMSQVLTHERNDAMIYSCDTFTGHAKVDKRFDGDHKENLGFADVDVNEVKLYLSQCPNVTLIVGNIEDTSVSIPNRKEIGILHVDVDVFPATKFCLEYFAPRISVGGFIVCHDYGFITCQGVKKAVDEFCKRNDNWKLIHLLTGQAILFKSDKS